MRHDIHFIFFYQILSKSLADTLIIINTDTKFSLKLW